MLSASIPQRCIVALMFVGKPKIWCCLLLLFWGERSRVGVAAAEIGKAHIMGGLKVANSPVVF